MAIPRSLWAYTKDDIVPLGDHIYKVLVPEGQGVQPTLMFIGTKVSGALVIPPTISDGHGVNFKVTEVGAHKDYNCKNVTSITLPETIERIGTTSFSEAKVSKITIPKNVAEIAPTAWLTMNVIPEFEVVTENHYFDSDSDGVLYTENKAELRAVPSSIEDRQ